MGYNQYRNIHKNLHLNVSLFLFSWQLCISKSRLTQHSPSHQDVEECLSIPAVVKFGARGIKELCNRFQISSSLVQALNDTFLKQRGVKSLLFICGGRIRKVKDPNMNLLWMGFMYCMFCWPLPLLRVLKRWPVSVGFCCFWLFIKDTCVEKKRSQCTEYENKWSHRS